ncbi:glycosyltransferase family 4 protein [Tessaracoccus palaemonis]|uniref:Glycosyltransferase n=1 Tax=Tessaracoccus palaemonis TaxID=2829499 RepID=A0ABX8SJ04_9ACTN|nr:glycosyltransferase [Tessaracoccus palaemonis]QXT62949.1 glycosyltransferase [Tessaracoccus palaemonis]
MSRLVFASNQGAVGGGEVMLLQLADAARSLGHDVTVVAPAAQPETLNLAAAQGFAAVGIHGRSARDYLLNLRAWDRSERSGLLWCNGLRPAFATAGRPGRVIHLHQQPRGPLQRMAASAAMQGAQRVLVPSQAMRLAVPSATMFANWTTELDLRHRIPGDDTVTVGFLGRLSPDKGVDVLARAIEALNTTRPGRFRLLLAGEGRFVDESDRAIVDAALGPIADVTVQAGWLDRADFFNQVDVAVFPSVWAEPFGLVAAEAMATGTPFVISDAGALPEVVGPDFPWIARSGDADDLARVIIAASENVDQTVTRAARSRWEDLYSPEAGRIRLEIMLAELDIRTPRVGTPHVALAHDYLTQRGGAERVVVAMDRAFPEAEISTSLYDPDATFPEVAAATIHTSPLNRVSGLRRNFRVGLPFFPWAFQNTPLDPTADAVIVSTTGFAHGIRTDKPKLVYCHSPARFLYLPEEYLGGPWWKSPKGWALQLVRPFLIWWDQRAAMTADKYLCNSTVVQRRIRDVYGIEATVLHPPAGLNPGGPTTSVPEIDGWPGHHLLVSRLMPYKNVDVAIDAFRGMPDERLVVVGRGPMRAALAADLPANVVMLEGLDDAQLRHLYATAKSVVAPSREDFGLTPVEGYGFGVPTLALRSGGYLDTVLDGVTGYFFEVATPKAVAAAVRHLAEHPLPSGPIREHAMLFSEEHFAAGLKHHLSDLLEQVA